VTVAARPAFDLDAALRSFGHEAFRPGQREAIETLFAVGRLLLVAPTGGGKSLTYQLPASLLPGTTLVISPLIALMADQVSQLADRGVAATYLASTVDPAESGRRQAALARGEYKLVYVAPERLVQASFRALLDRLECPLVVVDEAHCISEWGHDFRPEYMAIGEAVRRLGDIRVLACTATATPVVRDEILLRLGLAADTPQILRGFARPNLHLRALEVQSKRERTAAIDALLAEALGAPGGDLGAAIVYAPTRRECEAEAARLADVGWATGFYHAGRSAEDRERVHKAFLSRELEVVVATNAFGMGIDRADVRAVVHLAPPGSIEAYYQEVGRAGRDDAPAYGLLLVGAEDLPRRRRLLELGDGAAPSAELLEHKWSLFLELIRWAEGGSCRHDALLRYFGDEAETLAGCGHCDVCERLTEPDARDEVERIEIVRKALSGVARVSGRFGLRAAVSLLRGVKDERLERSGLDGTSTFGVLAEHPEEWLVRLLQRCVTAGWVGFRGDDRPIVELTAIGREVMWAKRPARILLPPAARARSGSRGERSRGAAAVARVSLATPEGNRLFDALRAWRQAAAKRDGVPAYVVAHDRTLRDLAELRPASHAELEAVWGLGPGKRERFGDELLAVVRGDPAPPSSS
jgi:ATP-dependent DNA helicase RecQ